MQDKPRGVIRNREYASQIRDFSGLLIGNITPTDIDGFIEYKDKCFIFVETKHNNAKLPFGQRLAFERLADACNKYKPTLFIIGSHNTIGDIDFANCLVTEYRFDFKWRIQETTITVKDMIMRFISSIKGVT